MLDPQLVELGRLDPPTVLLGSVTKEDVLVDGRVVNQRHIEGPETGASARIYKITSRLLLPPEVHTEALMMWKRARRTRRRGTLSAAQLVWIAARLRGRDVEPEELMKLTGRPGLRITNFMHGAHKLAEELGVDLPRRDHDRILLRAVDGLGVPRGVYHQVKALYPAARRIEGGDPRSTMGALFYLLAKPTRPALTQKEVAKKLGLKMCTVREVSLILSRELGPVPDVPGVPGLLPSLLSEHGVQASGRDSHPQDRVPVVAALA